MRIREYGPKRGDGTGVVIFAPRPLNGDVYKTDGQYDYIAQKTGHTILAAYRPIRMPMIIDGVRHRALLPRTSDEIVDSEAPLSQESIAAAQLAAKRLRIHAEAATSLTEELCSYKDFMDRPVRLGWGDSASGFLIALMQKNWLRPFHGVLLRESVNLHAPEQIEAGIQRILTQAGPTETWKPGAAQHVKTFQQHAPEGVYDRVRRFLSPQLRKLEFAAFGSIMCTTPASVNLAEDLAADPDVAFRYVGFTRGITGTRDQVMEFGPYLESLRTEALSLAPPLSRPQIVANAQAGTHEDLLNPSIAIIHIRETTGLLPGSNY